MRSTDERIEQQYHDQIWAAANDWMRVERAISEARDLCYLILSGKDDDLLQSEARRWVDTFGQHSLSEASIASDAQVKERRQLEGK